MKAVSLKLTSIFLDKNQMRQFKTHICTWFCIGFGQKRVSLELATEKYCAPQNRVASFKKYDLLVLVYLCDFRQVVGAHVLLIQQRGVFLQGVSAERD